MLTVVAMLFYIYVVTIAQLALSLVWLLCAAGLTATRGRLWFVAHLKRVAIFNATFLAWGVVVYTACHAATFGRAYVSHDTVLDWQPFIPFGDWVVQQRWGDKVGSLLGVSMRSLQTLWWVATAVVWTGTLLTFRRLTRARVAQTS